MEVQRLEKGFRVRQGRAGQSVEAKELQRNERMMAVKVRRDYK